MEVSIDAIHHFIYDKFKFYFEIYPFSYFKKKSF